MMQENLILKQIGRIHTPFKSLSDAPHQGRSSEKICEIELGERKASLDGSLLLDIKPYFSGIDFMPPDKP